jgi:adenylate cyclase
VTSLWLGDPSFALLCLEKSTAFYETEQHNMHAALYGIDLGVCSRAYAAWALAMLGSFEQALRRSEEALALAQNLNHAQTSLYALAITAGLRSYDSEWQLAQERAETIISLSERHGSVFTLALGTMTKGWVLAERGQEEVGRSLMHQGLAAAHDTGAELTLTYFRARLASVCEKAGQTEEGLTAVAEALATIEKTGEHCYEAELYRLKGELTLQLKIKEGSRVGIAHQEGSIAEAVMVGGSHLTEEEAEGYLLKAIEIARKQQAKSLELRAVMSLVLLRRQQAQDHESRTTQHESHNKLGEAHKMLSEVYNWFTEGFDTKDLQEAKELLEKLSMDGDGQSSLEEPLKPE